LAAVVVVVVECCWLCFALWLWNEWENALRWSYSAMGWKGREWVGTRGLV